jgi:hypothetical protein
MSRPFSKLAVVASAILAIDGFGSAHARTSSQVEMTCPYDGTKFTFERQDSGTAFGKTLDFMLVGPIQSPPPMAVCPTNRFVFFKETFPDAELDRLKPIILSVDYQALADETPYYRASWILERLGAPHVDVSRMLLAATWEAMREPGKYERYATELAARLPDDISSTGGDDRKMFQLLLGELKRRLGNFVEARNYFDDLSREFDPTSNDGLYVAFELSLIDRGYKGPQLIEEAIKAGDRNPELWLKRRTPTLASGKLTQTHVFRFDGLNLHWSSTDALTGSTRQNLLLFDLPSNKTTVKGPPVSWGNGTAFSPDGRFILRSEGTGTAFGGTGNDWRLEQIDTGSYKVRHTAPVPSPGALGFRFSYDGKSALASIETGLVAFDLGTDVLRPLPTPATTKHPNALFKSLFLVGASPTQPHVALSHDDEIWIWDYEKGAFVHRFRPEGWIKSPTGVDAIYGRDGKRLMVVTDAYWDRECEVTTWDTLTGGRLARTRVKGGVAGRMRLSPDGRLMAFSCGTVLYLSEVRLADGFVEAARTSGGFEFRELEFSPDSSKLAVRLDDALFIYSITR